LLTVFFIGLLTSVKGLNECRDGSHTALTFYYIPNKSRFVNESKAPIWTWKDEYMKETLPAAFLDKMKGLLVEEFEQFVNSYNSPRAYGLRINPLKLDAGKWHDLLPMGKHSQPIPWSSDGFYYSEEDRPGTHPYYNAGLYYIQEPSAMLPVELLDVRPGHRVLDLCAAPGGKSVQIGGRLLGRGVLVSNDNAYERTKPLAKNIAMAGIRNAIVLNEEPERLAAVFPLWFDRILVDAPCSGEGMFRKDESMAASWERHSVERCSAMQRDILVHAAAMLAPGGQMLYSTCTFSPEENEEQIAAFLAANRDFSVVPLHPASGLQSGRPDWIGEAAANLAGKDVTDSLKGAVRVWPHHTVGEGHFAVLLTRQADASYGGENLQNVSSREYFDDVSKAREAAPAFTDRSGSSRSAAGGRAKATMQNSMRKQGAGYPESPIGRNGRKPRDGQSHGAARGERVDPVAAWEDFCRENLLLDSTEDEVAEAFQDKVFFRYRGLPSLEGLKVIRGGWLLGEAKKQRFIPSQPLSMGLKAEQAARSVCWSWQDERVSRFLRGETLFIEPEELLLQGGVSAKGYVLVCVDGFPLGWGKYVDGMLKNELAAGWRRI
jgi:16S rRNA C967 or C1407 C5-methylase (RsmB/RsmF family)/NOL1/NOP2/fmu family ribosome biogenesis protein